MKFNEILENETKVDQTITVSNTYPVFLKVQKDMKNGIYLYQELKSTIRRSHESISGYSERFNNSLIEFSRNMYSVYKSMGYPIYEKLVESQDYMIEKIAYNNYNVLFLKSYDELILLNYVPINIEISILERFLIPDEMLHTAETRYRGVNYKAINTFNAFLSFAEINDRGVNKTLNIDFFGNFKRSIGYDSNYIKQYRKIPELEQDEQNYTFNEFKFYMFSNIIIISGYSAVFMGFCKKNEELIE
ncbi:hypothetical protein [Clostridium estertheticum]|uniref:hypothetical protein n=1 Tax=Clostridium estertheticum TaxID=238834 RepID=UPI001C7CE14D|nr:hypothetical protein [Clostridium estertheticum]MBX4267692.1 hypothetical protein [Clostridium estertheticum]WLC77941.1 hypothetical protein KTC98_11815 [Clostridium estertheticum]